MFGCWLCKLFTHCLGREHCQVQSGFVSTFQSGDAKFWSWLQLKVVNLCSLSCTYVGSRYFAKAKSIEKITNKYYQNLASSQLVWILSSERIKVIVDSVDADSSENVFKDQSRIISTSHRLQSNV